MLLVTTNIFAVFRFAIIEEVNIIREIKSLKGTGTHHLLADHHRSNETAKYIIDRVTDGFRYV